MVEEEPRKISLWIFKWLKIGLDAFTVPFDTMYTLPICIWSYKESSNSLNVKICISSREALTRSNLNTSDSKAKSIQIVKHGWHKSKSLHKHQTKQRAEQKEIKGGSQKKFEFWENVVAATIGDYLVNPRFLNQLLPSKRLFNHLAHKLNSSRCLYS